MNAIPFIQANPSGMNVKDDNWGIYSLTGIRAFWLQFLHAIPIGKISHRAALWLRKPLKSTLPEFVDVRVWGLKLRLRCRGNLSEQRLILMPQFLDHIELHALADSMHEGGVFLDIGANAGVYSLWVASQCLQARIEAFEPDAVLCERLSYNLATNALKQVHLNQIALGRQSGEVLLVARNGNQGQNRISYCAGSGQTVLMKTLVQILKERGIDKVRALKIDVEGMDMEVLEPFFQSTPSIYWPDMIICEAIWNEEENGLFHLLARNGYRLKQRTRMNGLFYRET